MDLDIPSLIQKLRDGQEIENPKLEIKREWYSLGRSDSVDNSFPVSEFLKDLVALANTPGPQGYLVIGIQEDYLFLYINFCLKQELKLLSKKGDTRVKSANL